MPITPASSATARASSSASCASTRMSSPSSARRASVRCASVVEVAEDAGAPRRRRPLAASSRCSSEKKPFASSGSVVAARAARRSSREPPKRRRRGSRPPPRRRCECRGRTRRSGVRSEVAGRRRAPLDLGDRAEAGRASASRTPILPREHDQLVQSRCSRARVDRFAGELEALAEVLGVAGSGDSPAALRSTADRWPPSAPAKTSRRAARSSQGHRRAARPRRSAANPSSSGSSSYSRDAARPRPRRRGSGPHGESSSIPSAPCTTYARARPSWTSASAIVRTSSGE